MSLDIYPPDNITGNASQTFDVAPATTATQAVQASQVSADHINFPVYTAPTAASGTPVPQGGAYTSASYNYQYVKSGKLIIISGYCQITTVGTATGYILIPLPVSSAINGSLSGKENGSAISASIQIVSGNLYINKYDGTTLNATGNYVYFGGSYISV
jgi:hypothetical protein